jgi:hypothetical protein
MEGFQKIETDFAERPHINAVYEFMNKYQFYLCFMTFIIGEFRKNPGAAQTDLPRRTNSQEENSP